MHLGRWHGVDDREASKSPRAIGGESPEVKTEVGDDVKGGNVEEDTSVGGIRGG